MEGEEFHIDLQSVVDNPLQIEIKISIKSIKWRMYFSWKEWFACCMVIF